MSTAARSRLRRARQAYRSKPCGSVALTCSVSTSATFFSSAPISMWHGAGIRFRRTSTGCCAMLPVVVETRKQARFSREHRVTHTHNDIALDPEGYCQANDHPPWNQRVYFNFYALTSSLGSFTQLGTM